MRFTSMLSILAVMGLVLALPNEGAAVANVLPPKVTIQPVADKKPAPEAPTSEKEEFSPEKYNDATKEALCKALDKKNREEKRGDSAKKPDVAPKTAPKSDGGPEVILASDSRGAEAAPAETTDIEGGFDKIVNNMSPEELRETATMCAKVDLAMIAKTEGEGTGDIAADTPAAPEMPVTVPGYSGGDYSGAGSMPTSPMGAGGTGMDAMLQQMLQQQMQQQMMQQMQAQQAANGQGQCPAGTTLTQLNGQMACVGKKGGDDKETAGCVALNGKTYCPENNCKEDIESGREVIKINGLTYCTPAADTDKDGETPAARDGYADGFASKGGNCGRDVDEKYTQNQEYLAAYARGLTDCRTAVVKRTSTTVVSTGVDDVAVRTKCKTHIAQLAKKMDVPTCLLEMAFRKQADLGGANQCVAGEGTTESDVFGYDGTRQQKLLTAKAQFDAGKVDAINDKGAKAKDSLNPDAYKLGHACGGELK